MKKDMKATVTQKATQEVLGKQVGVLAKQMGAAINALRAEARLSSGEAKKNASSALAELKQFNKVRSLQKKGTLTPEQSTQFLKGVEHHRRAIEDVIRKNSKLKNEEGTQLKGSDGKTITERLRAEQKEITTKDQVVALLTDIADRKESLNDNKRDEHKNIKTTLRQGLSALLGPAGPLIETLSSLRDEYGDDAKKIARKLSKWWKGDQDILKEIEKESGRNERRDKKLFGLLSDKFRKFSGLLGSGSRSTLDKIGDFFGWTGKGSGKGGMLTKAKRFARKIPGVGGLMRGGIGSKIAGGFGRMAGKGLGLAGKTLGRFLPGVGAAIGMHGLATMDDAKDSDTTGDKAMAYGGAALDGASVGAGIGGFIPVVGTIIGAVVGALGGVIYAGFKRNWKSVEDAASKSWTFTKDTFFKLVDGAKSFGLEFLNLPNRLASLLTSGVEKVYIWLKNNLPGFNALMEFGSNAGAAAVDAGKGAANWAGDKATTGAAAVGTAASAVATTAKNISTDAKVAVAGAVQTGANKVSETLDPVAKTLADSKSPINAAMGSAAATLSKSAQGVAAFAGKMAMPDKDIKDAVLGAADKVGVDKGYMMAMTAQESSFDPNAKAKTSSAKGLNQFIDGTWKGMVDKYGKDYGIGMNDQFDPKKNAMMGALFARDNANTLKGQGHDVTGASLYAAHMLGSGGANQLLSAIKKNPGGSAVDLMPKAAASNRGVFYNKDGSPKTVKEVYAYYQDKIESRAQAYNNALSKENGSGTQLAGSAVAPLADKASAASVSQSVAPGTDAFERANSVTPDANITLDSGNTNSNNRNTANNNGSVEHRQIAATDVPFVLGDNHMVVINAGMMGA